MKKELHQIECNMAVHSEAQTANLFLRLGLAEIQKITPENDFYDPLLGFLSSGLERIYKIILCLKYKDEHGILPKGEILWKTPRIHKGHDIVFLKTEAQKYFVPLSNPFLKDDYDILMNNSFIDQVCAILTAYAKHSRYFNMDIILGNEQEFNSKNEWLKLEKTIALQFFGEKEYYELLKGGQNLDLIFNTTNKLIVERLELYFRALMRQFEYGNFSTDSKFLYFEISDFINLRDERIGKMDYMKIENHQKTNKLKIKKKSQFVFSQLWHVIHGLIKA